MSELNLVEIILLICGIFLLLISFFLLPNQHHYMMMGPYYMGYLPFIFGFMGVVMILYSIVEMSAEDKLNANTNLANLENIQSGAKDDKNFSIALKLLNDDEAKILKIIHENDGITQDSIHFRTGFSHSKISMIMKKLGERDLIVREKFGKTYKLYLSEWLKDT